jgi:para-aminobenzoate synthetase/4-amino-4-deoxychorismate lyase
MGILSRLESTARGPYCGAFGVVFPGGDCVFNVPIRTLVLSEGNTRASYAVGSGVVADSDPGQEYDECLVKARILDR